MVFLGLAGALALAATALTRLAESSSAALGVVAVTGAVICGAVAVLCLLEAVAASAVSVRVTDSAVVVRPMWLPFAGMIVAMRTVRQARVVESPAYAWRSFGWWRSGHASDVAVRCGSALWLTLASGREIVISVADPEALASSLPADVRS